MKFTTAAILFYLLLITAHAQEKLLSPAEFLGYELGDRFTPHSRAVDYFRHVSSVMPNAELFQYGETYENRPLHYLVITSPENFRELERIRLDNLKRAGLIEGSPSADKTAIVWLSYNVHGNEASSMEASMRTLYELANPENSRVREWLKNTVVIMDPCVNPDGRDRYANFYNQFGNRPPNAAADAAEHHEPWPGGRSNHYFFDLNRDWAWCTQKESRQRIKIYNQWLPHVHVDFHEQGYNSPYFFAPAAEPLHEVISDWQRDFQLIIGKNNAKYFDEKGWLYFTKEVFDLYYPSYGDTYPTYNGAIGMTYEQAGGGAGGLTVQTETGQELTLRDRLEHHHTTGLATIEITSANAARVVDEFYRYFRENNSNSASQYKTYLIKAGNNADKLTRITEWLDAHAIRYGFPASTKTSRGFSYTNQAISPVTITYNDIVIPVHQPKARFITTVFEPSSNLSDSLTYDITAWNLMYANNLDAYALTERVNIGKPYIETPKSFDSIAKPYAYVFRYQTVDDVAFLSALMQLGIKVRSTTKSFGINGHTFPAGTLIVTRTNNDSVNEFDHTLVALARKHNRQIYTATSGLVEQGRDLGSGDLNFLSVPRIAVLFGEQTSSLSAGEIWHFFEQQIHFPITQIGTNYFNASHLSDHDVLIIPEGAYHIFDEPLIEQISNWVNRGGKLILLGNSLNVFADKKGFSLSKWASEEEKAKDEEAKKRGASKEGFLRYEDFERTQLSENISGAIYKVALDNSHPLGFGLKPSYYTLKTHERRFAWLRNGWNVAYFRDSVRPVQGFAGFKANQALTNSLVFGVEDKGNGEVVYLADNPLFRSFWEEGKMIFANAIFMVGQ